MVSKTAYSGDWLTIRPRGDVRLRPNSTGWPSLSSTRSMSSDGLMIR